MAELVHFKNFAKLKDTSIEFNDITVLAGKPGTGKSYIMKYFYAINDMFYQKIKDNLLNLEEDEDKLAEEAYANIPWETGLDKKINKLIKEKRYTEIWELLPYQASFGQQRLWDSIATLVEKLRLPLNKKIEFYLNNLIKSIFTNHNQISNSYQVVYQDIKFNYRDEKFSVILDEKKLFYKVEESIFVETPLILEFKKFIPKEKGKTPYHIESLLSVLDTDYSFTDIEQEKFIEEFRKKSKAIIDGDIENIGNSFIFNRKDDKNYDILNASSGIKSIGLLQYLVTNKALKKGSVLFWEEPEVHLHPSWQLKMVDLFVELMNAGVKIVFSTHSPYMADYLNAISQRNGYRDRVSFNLLKEENKEVKNYILKTDADWNMIQDELLGSLEDIMWEYL
jgi:predicted ATP-dependent endonuclease of OLD family